MAYTEWTDELREALRAPFPAEWHKTKRQGGAEITFVEWHRYADRLNELVGPDGWEIRLRFVEVGGKLITVAGLEILGTTKENVGDEDEAKDNYGTACTNSFAQSFKRAAALFGLGLYMYDKSGRDAAVRGGGRPSQIQGGALGSGTQATPKQLEYLDKLMRSSVLTEEERNKVGAKVASGDRATVSKALEWAKEQIDARKQPAGV